MFTSRPHASVAFLVPRFDLRQALFTVGIFLLLLSLTLKQSQDANSVTQGYWLVTGATNHFLIIYSTGLVFTLCSTLLLTRVGKFAVSPQNLTFFAFYVFFCLRILVDSETPIRVLLALVGQILLAVVCWTFFSNVQNIVERTELFFTGVRVWSVTYVLLTTITYLGGYGYPVHAVRFYGVAEHPNFAGVSLAVCSLIFVDWLLRGGSRLVPSAVLGLLLATASYLCFLTGSRTALLLLAVALSIYGIVSRRFSAVTTTVCVAFLAIIVVAAGSTDLYAAAEAEQNIADRILSTGDNRTVVWMIMLKALIARPLTGAGLLSTASENSYLKALSATGLFAGSLLTLSVVQTLASFPTIVRRSAGASINVRMIAALLLSVTGALVIGAFFEGYLAELGGPWVLMYFFLSQFTWALSRAMTTWRREQVSEAELVKRSAKRTYGSFSRFAVRNR